MTAPDGSVAPAPAATRPPGTSTVLRLLTRASAGQPAAAPVRLVHLGTGNFFRAHQAWYTAHARDAAQWGYAAFTGRSGAMSDLLTRQDGLYTLIVRSAVGDEGSLIPSVSRALAGTATGDLVDHLADPEVVVVTLTVTEAGYVRTAEGGLDLQAPGVAADLAALHDWLQRDRGPRHGHPIGAAAPPLRTVPARLAAGFAARRASGAGPLAVVPCDNLAGNGRAVAAVVDDVARRLDQGLAAWIQESISYVATVVDRITPATREEDRATAARLTGLTDQVPVVTEPFSEWVLAGDFPGGRPHWEDAGALFVDDVTPYEQRKLWALNGGHSLLAYLGGARGHTGVAEATADPVVRAALHGWWDLVAAHLPMHPAEIADYRVALLERFSNPALRHELAQIAVDGSQKLPVRLLPVLRLERTAGRIPGPALVVLGAWVAHLRGCGVPVRDAAAQRFVPLAQGPLRPAAEAVLAALAPDLAGDELLAAGIAAAVDDLIT